ncbi:hypothetical protein K439DRAFT_1619899 [Ramaria rubella]|nr:hypothetical protein K439DRAFT_1619899 [Ramaria rubella]
MPVGQSSLPYLNFQQKVFTPKPQACGSDLSREKHQANALLAEGKRTRLWQDLQDHWRAQEALAEELAVKHGKTVKWIKDAVLHVDKYGTSPCKVGPHIAWLHAKSLEINPNLDPGEKENDCIATCCKGGRVLERCPKGRDGQDDEVFGVLVKKGICAKPLSQMATVCQVHDRIEKNLVALGQSCKTSSLCVTIQTAPHHLNTPMFAADDISKDFIEIVLGWDINEFCLKYESFALFRLKGEITGNPTLDMSWKNYEKDIVDEYHVIMEGWPSLVFDPSKLGFKGLEPILQAIEDGICKWRWLTDDEFTARKNEVAANGGDKKKVRKERSDKGKKRGTYKGSEGSNKKSHGPDSGSEEDSSKSSNNED